MLTDAPHRFAEALDLMGAADALPAVFHCAAGKDRTGVTAMLVLGSLGVPREYIAADYQLTAEAMDRMLAWAQRQAPELFARMADMPEAFRGAMAEAMFRLVDRIEAQHGSVRAYALAIGVQAATLTRFEAELLE